MGCVNKATKEFKQLAEKHNISSNRLELIVHKYWEETGNEEVFPSSLYIQAELGGTRYKESGAAVRKLWDKEYRNPKEFDNVEDVQKAAKEAEKYFPASAVVFYEANNGKYILKVRQPVAKLTYDNIMEENSYARDSQYYKDYDLIVDRFIEEMGKRSSFAKEAAKKRAESGDKVLYLTFNKNLTNRSEISNIKPLIEEIEDYIKLCKTT